MRIGVPKNVWRLGVLVLALAATLAPARPAASCVDDVECARNCDIMCRCDSCDPADIQYCQEACYRQCECVWP